ncbi:response regulator [Oribacterium sp. oral taxon 102]|uniref:response regulator n=1 Tax=Oribacterium sp. oral taxon 102 TaxID=671214 RepID=UPI0015BDD804|nr:response regulator [Oribacterium sp. oral taxon 102]NWO20991.1 response regulator [Oribacterium sp. oral taxon 102]
MYNVFIVDDEPLVQIGLRSMLQRDFASEVTVSGSASNGKDALRFITEQRPDIVFADIKMPLMSGLELQEECRKRFGELPVFIILTAYEDFALARTALANRAADYIVKIELSTENLRRALERAVRILREHKKQFFPDAASPQDSIAELKRRFLSRLLRGELREREQLLQEASELGFERFHDRYLTVYCEILPPISVSQEESQTNDRLRQLCTTCCTMAEEIIRRRTEFLLFPYDLRHFTLLFYFEEGSAVADRTAAIDEALENAREMIRSYFNASLRFGIGTVVNDPLQISESFQEAKTAEEQTNESAPIRRFSHIVGANRRSGKDRLIAEIQHYIDENLSGKLLLNEIAESFGLSPAYLSVIFKKNTEIGFSEYVYTKKIERAKQMLLSGDMKIYEVADALGFESAYYFSKVFKKVDGHSPREYIQQKSEGSDPP